MQKNKTIPEGFVNSLLKVADDFEITMNGKQFREIISQERKQWEKDLREKIKERFCDSYDGSITRVINMQTNYYIKVNDILSLLESKEECICGCPMFDENSMCINQEHLIKITESQRRARILCRDKKLSFWDKILGGR